MDSPFQIGAEIFNAGVSGDFEKLKEIKENVGDVRVFRKICDVYTDFSTGRRVLHHAAEMGNLEICEFLVEHVGVYVDASSYKGDTPALDAAREERVTVVKYLINKGALVQVSNAKGFTSLHYAILKDNMELIQFLVENGAPLEGDSVDGSPLQCAASRGNVEAVKLLLQQGAEPNSIKSAVPGSPLIGAIKSHSFECMQLLIQAKADPDKFLYGLTALGHAAKEADTRYLKCLLEAGAKPDKPSTGRLRPIEDAALVNNLEAVKILFPLTEKIPDYPNWSVEGIIKHCRSRGATTKREKYLARYLEVLDSLGKTALTNSDHTTALDWYSEAVYLDPSNFKWLSIRSLCYARVGNGVHALRDAAEAVRLNPQQCPCPKPHYQERQGHAWSLFKRYHFATVAFLLEPENIEIRDAFRSALFEYFSWLYLMSCPAEMTTFFNHFL